MAANFYPNLIADLGGDPGNPTALPGAGLGPDPNAQPLVGNLVNVGPGGGPLAPVIGANPQSAPNIPAQLAGPAFTPAQMQTMTNAAVVPASVIQEMANANKTPYQTAMEVALRSTDYLQNANVSATKANEFREVAVERLRTIFNRLQSINAIVAQIQQGAGAAQQAQQMAQQAQQALVDLINAVNSQGYINQNQADAMADLASQLTQLNIPQMMAGLVQQINNLSFILRNELQAPGGLVAPDALPPLLMIGGRRKKKKAKRTRKKKHKGGYKFTRAAISRRSLRQSRRKSLRSKRKRTRKHHKRKRRKHR
jgi:hypothetical protein